MIEQITDELALEIRQRYPALQVCRSDMPSVIYVSVPGEKGDLAIRLCDHHIYVRYGSRPSSITLLWEDPDSIDHVFAAIDTMVAVPCTTRSR